MSFSRAPSALSALPRQLWASAQPGFELHDVWKLSVATTLLQAALCAVFLRGEFRRKLPVAPPLVAASEPAA